MKTLLDHSVSATALLAIALVFCVHTTGLAQQPAAPIVLTMRPSFMQMDLTGVLGTNTPAVRDIGTKLDRALYDADLPAMLDIARTLRALEVTRRTSAPALNAHMVCEMMLADADISSDKAALTQLKALLDDHKAGFGTSADQPLIKASNELIALASASASASASAATIRTRGSASATAKVSVKIKINNKTRYPVDIKVENVVLWRVKPNESITRKYNTSRSVIVVRACGPRNMAFESRRVNVVANTNIWMELSL